MTVGDASLTTRTYVALGDSLTAGVGVFFRHSFLFKKIFTFFGY